MNIFFHNWELRGLWSILGKTCFHKRSGFSFYQKERALIFHNTFKLKLQLVAVCNNQHIIFVYENMFYLKVQSVQLFHDEEHVFCHCQKTLLYKVLWLSSKAIKLYKCRVYPLVRMLLSLEGPQGIRLKCLSDVVHLLAKLPRYNRDGFIDHLQLKGSSTPQASTPLTYKLLLKNLLTKAKRESYVTCTASS